MDQTRIRELYSLLPPGAAYPAIPRCSPFRPAQFPPAERFAMAMRDPAFGAGFVGAFVEKRRWLPDNITEWPLLQYFLSRVFKVTEPVILEVESFRTETRRQERNLLDALLLADDTTLAGIAEILSTREAVVSCYEVLFFNVRDRRSEQGYLNSLLHPEGWQAAIRDPKPNAEGDRLRLLRAAKDGQDQVLALAGWASGKPAGMERDATSRFDLALQTDADRRWSAGARLEDPVIKAAHQGSLRRQENTTDDDKLALHHINAVSPALDDLRKYNCIGSPPRPERDLEKDRAEIMAMLRTGAVKPRE